MKAADEWQELTNILSDLISKYACTLSSPPLHQQADKTDLHSDEISMPKTPLLHLKQRDIILLHHLSKPAAEEVKNSAAGDWRKR